MVLFELLTGTRPYDGATDMQTTINSYTGKRTRDLASLAPETPEAFVQIVHSLTESSPDARLPNAVALLSALRADAVLRLGAMARVVKGMVDAEAREGATEIEKTPRGAG